MAIDKQKIEFRLQEIQKKINRAKVAAGLREERKFGMEIHTEKLPKYPKPSELLFKAKPFIGPNKEGEIWSPPKSTPEYTGTKYVPPIKFKEVKITLSDVLKEVPASTLKVLRKIDGIKTTKDAVKWGIKVFQKKYPGVSAKDLLKLNPLSVYSTIGWMIKKQLNNSERPKK